MLINTSGQWGHRKKGSSFNYFVDGRNYFSEFVFSRTCRAIFLHYFFFNILFCIVKLHCGKISASSVFFEGQSVPLHMTELFRAQFVAFISLFGRKQLGIFLFKNVKINKNCETEKNVGIKLRQIKETYMLFVFFEKLKGKFHDFS